MKNAALISLFILIPSLAHAVDLSETTTAGSALFEQSFAVDGEGGGNKEKDIDAPWTWNLEYDYMKSKVTNTAGTVTDHTNDFSGNGGWRGQSGLGLDAGLQYSSTKEENLISRGGTLSPSYRWEYNHPTADEFSPYFETKFNLGSSDYQQTFEGKKRLKKTVTVPVNGTAEIRQSLFGVDLNWRPVHDWRIALGFDHYSYNRDVAKFESSLDSPAGLQRGVSGFSNTVGGLPRVTYSAKIAWYFARDWKNTLSELYSIAAADSSVSTTVKDVFDYKLNEQWRITAGAKDEHSSTLNDFLGIVGLEWDGD